MEKTQLEKPQPPPAPHTRNVLETKQYLFCLLQNNRNITAMKFRNVFIFHHDLELTLKKSKNPTSGVLPTCFSLSLKKNQPVMPASSSSGFALDRDTRWRRSSRLSRPRKNARSVLLLQGGPGKQIPNC